VISIISTLIGITKLPSGVQTTSSQAVHRPKLVLARTEKAAPILNVPWRVGTSKFYNVVERRFSWPITLNESIMALLNPYKSLGKDQIRLAEIRSAAFNHEGDDVICCLSVFSRNHPPPYRALSYCWENSSESSKGKILLEVSKNELRWWPVRNFF